MLTVQQHAFVNAVRENTNLSYILQALAGTGKTFTLLESCPAEPTLAVAFNKRIQTELDAKFPANADCLTFNGLGHRTWMKYIGRRAIVDTGKLFKLTRAFCEDADDQRLWKSMSEIMTLVNAARQLGLVHSAIPQTNIPLVPDDPAIWQDFCDNDDIPEFCIEPARQILKNSTESAMRGEIDFADQLYMPVVFRGPFPRGKYQSVIVDEAQDLGPLEHAMIELSLGKNARLIAAGDHHQAIYGWRGAHSDSMLRLQEKTSASELPLTITWRCPKAVVAEANKIVPEYEAAPEAPDGSVTNLGTDWDYSIFSNPDSVILCRNNKPLFSLAMKLIRNRISCRMEGRDIGVNLKRIIKDITHEENLSSSELSRLAMTWMNDKIDQFSRKGDDAKAAKAEDQGMSILAVAEECRDTRETVDVIDTLFGRKSKGITLSTIHKAKGLEWQHVYILDRHLIGKWAKADWAREQERNLEYVAITRAMKSLSFITTEEK